MDPNSGLLNRINILPLLITIIPLCFITLSLYRHWTDPLRSIPGPFLAKTTGAWAVILELSGKRSFTIHKLHEKYGPVVRIGPNELCFASPQAMKDIYGASSKFTKAPIYDSLGFKSVFTTRDRDDYRVMKKRILPTFSSASVAEMEASVHRQVANLMKCFDKRVDQVLDVLPWFRMLALGVVGENFAQESFGGLETEKTPELLNHIDAVFPVLWVNWMFPITSKILKNSPLTAARKFLQKADDFNKYCAAAYKKYLASFDPTDRHDLIARMVNERTSLLKQGEAIPRHVTERGIIDEITNLIFAGTDTTGNTLTYLFWDLANNPKWQLLLREELKEVIGEQAEFDYKAISELPILEAVVQEILRLRPAAPASLQRLVPENGGIVDGVPLPSQVTVSCQALTAQREPTLFPNPNRFDPQRWIDAEKLGTLELMREQIMVFGKGARACLGRRLAMMEIKCATAAIVRRYDVKIGSATTDDDMEMRDHTVLIPKGQRCILQLSRVQG